MQVKETAASLVLGLLFVSLLAIYLVTDQNPLVTGLSIILIAMCLIIVQIGSWREVGIIGVMAMIVSIIAVYFVGRERYGGIGSVLLPIVWALLVFSVFSWISRNLQEVPGDRAILVSRTYYDRLVNLEQPLAPPLIPFLERTIAIIPLYPLSTDLLVESVNTAQKDDVPSISIHVEYKIADRNSATKALGAMPNRSGFQGKIAKAMNKSVAEAQTDPQFWERLLEDLIKAEVDDITRDVVFRTFQSPKEVYQQRNASNLADQILAQLRTNIADWGVVATALEIDRINVPGDKFRSQSKKDEIIEKNQLDADRIRLRRQAEAEVEAERVRRLVKALRDEDVHISETLVQDIITSIYTDIDDQLLASEIDEIIKSSGKKN